MGNNGTGPLKGNRTTPVKPDVNRNEHAGSTGVSVTSPKREIPTEPSRPQQPVYDRTVSVAHADRPVLSDPAPALAGVATGVSPLPQHTVFELRDAIKREDVITAGHQSHEQMIERLAQLEKKLGWRSRRQLSVLSSSSATSLQPSGPLMTVAMGRAMLDQIAVMERGVAEKIDAGGRTQAAWQQGILMRYELERMHKEVYELAEFFLRSPLETLSRSSLSSSSPVLVAPQPLLGSYSSITSSSSATDSYSSFGSYSSYPSSSSSDSSDHAGHLAQLLDENRALNAKLQDQVAKMGIETDKHHEEKSKLHSDWLDSQLHVNKLQSENTYLSDMLAENGLKSAAYEVEIDELQSEQERLLDQINQFRSQTDYLQVALQKANSEKAQQETVAESIRHRLESSNEEELRAKQQLQHQLDQAELAMQRAEDDISGLHTEIQEQQESQRELLARAGQLEKSLQRSTDEAISRQDELDKLKGEVSAGNAKIISHEAQLLVEQAVHNATKRTVASQSQELERLRNEISEATKSRDKQAKLHDSEVQTLNRVIRRKESELGSLVSEREQLGELLVAGIEEVDELEKEKTRLLHEQELLKAQVSSKEDELKNKTNESDTQANTLKQQLTELEGKLAVSANSQNETQKALDEKKEELEALRSELSKTTQSNDEQVERHILEVQNLKEELGRIEDEQHSLLREREHWRALLIEGSKAIELLENEKAKLKHEQEELNTEINTKKNELKNKNDESDAQAHALKQQLTELEKRLVASSDSQDEIQKFLDGKEKELEEVRRELVATTQSNEQQVSALISEKQALSELILQKEKDLQEEKENAEIKLQQLSETVNKKDIKLESLTSELEVRSQENKELQASLSEERKEISELKEKKSELESEQEKLKQEISNKEDELSSKVDETDSLAESLRKQLQTLKDEKGRTENTLDALKESLKQKEDELLQRQQEKSQAEDLLAQSAEKLRQLEEEKNDLEKQKEQVSSNVIQLKDTIDELHKEREEERKQLIAERDALEQQKIEEVESLQKQLADINQQLDRMRESAQQSGDVQRQQIISLEKEKQELKQAISTGVKTWEKEKKLLDDRIAQSSTQLAELGVSLAKEGEEVGRLTQEVTRLTDTLSECEQKCSTLSNEKDESVRRIGQLQSREQLLQETIDRQRDDLNRLEEQSERIKTSSSEELAELKEQIEDKQSSIENLEKLLKDLGQEKSDAHSRVAKLEEEILQFKNDSKKAASEFETIKKQQQDRLDSLNSEKDRLSADIAALEKKLSNESDSRVKEREEASKNLNQRELALEEAKTLLNEKTESAEQLSSEVEQLKARVESLQNRSSELSESLESEKRKYSESDRSHGEALEQLQNQLHQLRTENGQTSKELSSATDKVHYYKQLAELTNDSAYNSGRSRSDSESSSVGTETLADSAEQLLALDVVPVPRWTEMSVSEELNPDKLKLITSEKLIAPQLYQMLTGAWQETEHRLKQLDAKPELHQAEEENILSGHSRIRQEKIEAFEALEKLIIEAGTSYLDTLQSDSDHLSRAGEDEFLSQLKQKRAEAASNARFVKEQQQAFDNRVRDLESTLQKWAGTAGGVKENAEQIVDSELRNMVNLQRRESSSEDREFLTVALGKVAQSATKRLLGSMSRSLEEVKTPDQGHAVLQEHLHALKRLNPRYLPSTLKPSFSVAGEAFLTQTVRAAEQQLVELLDSKWEQTGSNGDRKSLERRLLENPEICDRIATLLSSLQESHAGVQKQSEAQWQDFDYVGASLLGLQQIREEFGLSATPHMGKLLMAVENDLKRAGSNMLTASLRRHQGRYDAKVRTRRDKMLAQCSALLQREKQLTASEQFRGQPINTAENKIQQHPHQNLLDLFQSKNEKDRVALVGNCSRGENFNVWPLDASAHSIVNGFMSGFAQQAVMKVSEVTGDRYVELEGTGGCQPPLLFQSRDGMNWEIRLDGRSWQVDPAFLYDHPDIEVPFQSEQFGHRACRDWIPLKSASGQTAILAAQKTPREAECFLYEAGPNSTLQPVPVRGGDPYMERLKAEFLYRAARLTSKSPAETGETVEGHEELDEMSGLLLSLRDRWLPNVSRLQLQHCCREVVESVNKRSSDRPFDTTSYQDKIDLLPVRMPPTREVLEIKSGHDSSGSKLTNSNAAQYAPFTVNSGFEHVNEVLVAAKKELLNEQGHALTGAIKDQQLRFKGEAFKNLAVFNKCELQHQDVSEQERKNSRRDVATQFSKVVRSNRLHCLSTRQAKKSLEKALVGSIRKTVEGDMADWSDREVLDHAIRQFEQGYTPEGVNDTDGFIRRMTWLMLLDIDLEQSGQIGHRLQRLEGELQQLGFDRLTLGNEEYAERCRQWNLEMALTATRQLDVNRRIRSYSANALDTKTRALLSFERRHGVVLSEDQAAEMDVTLDGVTRWVKGEEVAMISHKGTGYGKSTLLLALTDHACAQLGSDAKRSVVVVAPETNQAELDINLGQYYARKGQGYRRLDLQKCFQAPCRLSAEKLLQVENTLLGLPAEALESDRADLLQQGRVPVGASIVDVQILMQLRESLGNSECAVADRQQLLAKVNDCLDLLRNSMIFADEWDSALVPHTEAELPLIADKVQSTVNGLGINVAVQSEQINLRHAEFVFGCKARHLLSATLATPYTAAMASGTSTVEDVQKSARTDPVTTNQRFWHFLTQAEPVFFNGSKAKSRETMLEDIVRRVGSKPQIILFDGAEGGEHCTDKARQMSRTLNRVRRELNGDTKSVMYYDDDKNLQLQHEGDPVYGHGAPMDSERVTLLRRDGGQPTDGYLTKAQSVGTDMPQGTATVGVFQGLFGQHGNEANENLLVQQMGRLTRASKDLHKPQRLFVAVDLDAIDQLDRAAKEKKKFLDSRRALEAAMAELSALVEGGIDNATPRLASVIAQGITIAPVVVREGSDPHQLRLAEVKKQLQSLQRSEWKTLGLSGPAVEALTKVKELQWQNRQDWLELVVADVAVREKSQHTLNCEQQLTQAQVNSHLDRVFADEYRWIVVDGVKAVEECTIRAELMPNEARKNIAETLRLVVAKDLQAWHRRTRNGSASIETITEYASSDETKKQLQVYFEHLKENGITITGDDLVDSANRALIEQSRKAFGHARERIQKLYDVCDALGDKSTGKEHIAVVLDQLDQYLNCLGSPESGKEAVSIAMDTEQLIQASYEAMMESLLKLTFILSQKEQRATQGKLMRAVKGCVVLGNSKKTVMKSTSNKVGKQPASGNAVKGSTDESPLKMSHVGPDAVKKLQLRFPKGYTNRSVQKLRWHKKGSSGRWLAENSDKTQEVSKGHYQYREDVLTNKEAFVKSLEVAKALQTRQSELDDAIKLCQKPDERFSACVEEVESALMERFNQKSEELSVMTERQKRLMQDQTPLAQKNLFR